MRIRSQARSIALTISVLGAAALPVDAQSSSLYQRLGGYDAIAAIVDDFFGRFDADATLTPFLGGLNTAAQGRIRQNFIDYFCAESGGPCLYNGRDMAAAHQGLDIQASQFDAVMAHLGDAMESQGIAPRERDELTALLRPLRGAIVAGSAG